MKKTLLLLTISIFTFAISYSQSLELREVRYNLSIRRFPLNPLDTSYKTFSVEYPQGNIVSNEFGIDFRGVENTNIPGFKRVNGIGHLVIKYSFLDARIVMATVRQINTDQKNINGQVIATTIEYVPTFTYTLNAKADIFDFKGNLLKTEICKVADKTVDAGPERFREYRLAEQYLFNNRVSIYSNTFTNELNNFVVAVNYSLANNYGWPLETPNAHIWSIENKKHPEYLSQEQASTDFVTWSAGFYGDQSPSESQKAQSQNFLTYYEGLKAKYSADDKHERKIRYEAFYNKGIIYLYFLNDFDKAINEGMGLIANDHDKHDGKWIIEEANRYKQLLAKSNRTSLRFPINLQNALPPSR